MSANLYTIGYQGRSTDGLLGTLRANGVDTVVDVRELPLSRIRGFSKTRLAHILDLAGINYVSVRQLGSPRDMRREYRQTGDWNTFALNFQSFLQTQQAELDRLVTRVYAETVCLLCFEETSSHCHRSIVADMVKTRSGNGLRITHL
jgi:uncharacterized protein (DUF488 family)